jgi:hypothetical protein
MAAPVERRAVLRREALRDVVGIAIGVAAAAAVRFAFLALTRCSG